MNGFKTAAAMTVLCAALGACADLTPHPQYPVRPEPVAAAPPPAPAPTPAPVAPVVKSDDDAPIAHPSTPVQSSPLAPPPGAKVAPPKKGAMLEVRDVLMLAAASDDSLKVGKGDTLAKLAKKAGVSIEDLAKANKLEPPYKLKIGQTLTVPGDEPAASSAPPQSKDKSKGKSKTPAKEKAAAKPEAKPTPSETISVGKGDTLASLARTAGVSVKDLAKANGLKSPYKLKIGQTLTLPGGGGDSDQPASSATSSKTKAAPKAEPKPAAETSVKVGKGDTLKSIADKAGVPVSELAKLNHLKKPYRLKRGQKIKLPGDDNSDAASGAPPESARPESRPESRTESRAEPARTITAGRHDTLQGIADKAGVSVSELAKLNHLKKPYRVKRGQKIKLPGHAAAAVSGGSYRVKKGDTLYSIARQNNVTVQALADANGLDLKTHLNVGRRLQLPGGPLDRPATRLPSAPIPYAAPLPLPPGATSAPPSNFSSPGPAGPQPYAPQPYTRPAPGPDAAGPPATGDADVAAAGKGFFQWPVHGDTLSGFGPKTGGQRNDGVDIAAPAGTGVRAAAAGEVVYAGNSVPGFGNLVLIRHDGGWITAYAHLANIDVKMRQTVTQGQQIGEVGQTGGVDQPQVHFEVRYAPNLKDKARPIDPMLVLPNAPLP